MSIFKFFSSSNDNSSSSAKNKKKHNKSPQDDTNDNKEKEKNNEEHEDEDEDEDDTTASSSSEDEDNEDDDEEEYADDDEECDDATTSSEKEDQVVEGNEKGYSKSKLALKLGKTFKKSVKKSRKESLDNPLLPEEMCELPSFFQTVNCEQKLLQDTRERLKKKYSKRPNNFIAADYEQMLVDDWTVSRFLLRCRNNPKRAAKLMEECGKFRQEYRMGLSKSSDFPIEFHKSGGLFRYEPDRVGNQTLYMRIKMHLRNSELSKIMKEFILCTLEECDKANNGRGTAIIFDLTGCGLQNVDLAFLFWLVFSFRNYCPKGLSYIVIYNLPWILNATAKLALSWLSSTNRKRMRFVSGDAIFDFVDQENLPDFMGGTCKRNYRLVPEGSRYAIETAEQYGLTKEQSRKIRDIYVKFLKSVEPNLVLYDDDDHDYDEDKCDKNKESKQHQEQLENININDNCNSAECQDKTDIKFPEPSLKSDLDKPTKANGISSPTI